MRGDWKMRRQNFFLDHHLATRDRDATIRARGRAQIAAFCARDAVTARAE